jgi:hypothetical protein
MAWRIADFVIRGEIDNRERDQVVGKIWIHGREQPIQLELSGNPWRDLAGQFLRFENPNPRPLPEHMLNFASEQTGVVGDITAARKVKILDIPDGEFEHYYTNKIPMPYHWGNSLYLEWHSKRNGRVVIEAADYTLTVEPSATWQMSEEEEAAQHTANAQAMIGFIDQLLETDEIPFPKMDIEDDAPQSRIEAEADAEAARSDLLNDRIEARVDREAHVDAEMLKRIIEEERERLRQERGEAEPEDLYLEDDPTERAIHEDEILRTLSEEDDYPELETHPLVERCGELCEEIYYSIEVNEWLPKHAHHEHPLHELLRGLRLASAKLAGALNGDPEDWPPDPLFAGNVLVRLKKARGYLADALAALDSAKSEKLAEPDWLATQKQEIEHIQQSTQHYINEIRAKLSRIEGMD